MNPTPIDLHLDGIERAVSAWLVEADDGPALIDPGPSTTLEALETGMAAVGIAVRDLRHVVLTHIHLDHAGATGHLAHRVPGMTVHVHEDGAPHLVDPDRLVASTRRTFGDAHDRLWGDVMPVPAGRIRGWRPGEAGPFRRLRPFPTPGHIDHHTAWLDTSVGTLLAGDSMGLILAPGAPAYAPTPPPAVDLAAWRRTLDTVADVGPDRIGIAHFGIHGDPPARVEELRMAIDALEARVEEAIRERTVEEDTAAYDEEVRAGVARARDRAEVDRYFDVFGADTDYRGVVRWVEKGRGR